MWPYTIITPQESRKIGYLEGVHGMNYNCAKEYYEADYKDGWENGRKQWKKSQASLECEVREFYLYYGAI